MWAGRLWWWRAGGSPIGRPLCGRLRIAFWLRTLDPAWRARIGEMIAAQVVEDEADLQVPRGQGLYHRYNAVLKRVLGNTCEHAICGTSRRSLLRSLSGLLPVRHSLQSLTEKHTA